jgi:hypothetical protein
MASVQRCMMEGMIESNAFFLSSFIFAITSSHRYVT